MTDATAGILGAAIGFLGGLLSAFFTTKWQRDSDRERWQREQAVAREEQIRAAIAELARPLAVGVHSMCWLAWVATNQSEQLKQSDIDAYDREVHDVFAQLMAAQAVLASVDRRGFEAMRGLLKEFVALDMKFGRAGRAFATNPHEAVTELKDCHAEAVQFESSLAERLGDVMSELIRRMPHASHTDTRS